MARLELTGIHADTLIGFMAGLGTLRLLTRHWPDADIRLAWAQGFPHRAALSAERALSAEGVLDALEAELHADGSVFNMPDRKDVTFEPQELANRLLDQVMQDDPAARDGGDLLRALASPGSVRLKSNIADQTPFVMLGAGQTSFLGAVRSLIRTVGRDHLERTLFRAWDYADHDLDSLRWDPEDGREHAYTLHDPAAPAAWKGNLHRRMAGANRLALSALPCFPTVPTEGRRDAVGVWRDGRRSGFAWPVWAAPCTLATARSLLTLLDVTSPAPDGQALRARGIVQVMRAERSMAGRYPTLLPATAML
jgi:hypothetical protein